MSKQQRPKWKDGVVLRGNKWYAVVRVPNANRQGTKQQWSPSFSTEKEAKRWRDEARSSLHNKTYVAPSKVRLGEYISQWIGIHAKTKPLEPTTEANYRHVINSYIKKALGQIEVQELTSAVIRDFYLDLASGQISGKQLSASTVRTTKAVLLLALQEAVDVDGLIMRNPAKGVKVPQVEPRSAVLWSKAQLYQFLDAIAEHRLFALYWLATFSGARRGELLALRWSDINLETGEVSINKNRVNAAGKVFERLGTKSTRGGYRARVVPIDPETLNVLRAHRKQQLEERFRLGEAYQETGYVFAREDGLPIHIDTVGLTYRRYRKRLGLPEQRFHDLRHFHATTLLEAGEPLHVVAERLGHKDPMVTARIYAHVTPKQSESAALKFAAAFTR